jgi:CheY-like chemotaxis protein
MQVLVIDRDEMAANLIKSRLEPVGHRVAIQADKSAEALDTVAKENWDVIFIDPSPLTNPKPLVQSLRRSMRRYPYTILLSSTLGLAEALTSAMNDALAKPVDPTLLDTHLANAARLSSIMKHMGDDSEDFKSAGGVIAKSAFNQLFLSCIERADRYGENSFLLYITMSNYNSTIDRDGEVDADIMVAKMAKHLVRLRRQSDIIGQTRRNEYVLLMQRPAYESEPVDAANRFAEALSKCTDIIGGSPLLEAEMTVSLIDLPTASLVISHKVDLRKP